MRGAARALLLAIALGVVRVLGAVPLAISSGAGAESREQLGLVIVGGMTFGTLLTLFVLPAFYTYISRQPQAKIEVPQAAAA